MKKKRGFSLVEILAVMALLGVIAVLCVVGVNRYIERSHEAKEEQDKNNATMTTELYLQSNPDQYPQNIGETVHIPFSALKDSHFLKEDITNYKGESCMENSVVRVYKLDQNEYSYTAFLYCGNDPVPTEDPVEIPVVTNFQFTDNKITSGNGHLSDVKAAQFSFTMRGSQYNSSIGIYSYRYVIYAKKNGETEYTEVYNTGHLKGGLDPKINIHGKLVDFVDVTGYTMFIMRIEVINEQGGELSFSSDSVTTDDFVDNEKPICGMITGDATSDDDWINKANYASNAILTHERRYPGRITVTCNDGMGSGCKREQFTKTWPNDSMSDSGKVNYQYGARWGVITISDNAVNKKHGNNETKCYVRVNVDVQAPSITLYAYNAKTYEEDRKKPALGAVATASAKDEVALNGNIPQGTIQAKNIRNAVGSSSEKWLNAENYPDGIILDATLSDNLYLDYWTWETNDAYLPGGSSHSDISAHYSQENAQLDGSKVTGTFSKKLTNKVVTNDAELLEEEIGDTTGSITGLKLTLEGKRYGRLTVYDKAGNKTIIHVYANMDRTAPEKPVISYRKQKTGGEYTPANKNNYLDHEHWSNETLYAYIKDQKTDSYNNPNHLDLSGWDHFIYRLREQDNQRNTWKDPVESMSLEVYTFGVGFKLEKEGTHRLSFEACDKAGNCSSYSKEDYIKIDTVKPECGVSKTYHNTKAPNTAGWLKKGESVTLTHTCSESDTIYSSGCNKTHPDNVANYTYDTDINTSKAGALGDNEGGYVWDYAGNKSDVCPHNITVKIDTEVPTCTIRETYIGTDTLPASGWLKSGQSVILSHICSDSKKNGVSSGCDANHEKNQQSYSYDFDINTNVAGAAGIGLGGTVMDIAGNESDECPKMTVKVDHTAPTCSTRISYPEGEPTSEGWLGIGKSAVVSQVCDDSLVNGVASGCVTTDKSHTYKDEIQTTTAGAGGNSNGGGKVYDVAGNVSRECPADQTVQIDLTPPVCSSKITLGSASGKNYTPGKWVNRTVVVSAICSDGGRASSGCRETYSDVYDQDKDSTVQFTYQDTLSDAGSPHARVYDKANNVGDCSDSYHIRIDKTAPVAACTVTGQYTNNVSNHISLSDQSYDPVVNGASSGLKSTSYSLDGSNYSSSTSRQVACGNEARSAGGAVSVIDEAGNTAKGDCTGAVEIPACCSAMTDWIDGTTCTVVCGGGTYNRYKNSLYSGAICLQESSGGSSCHTFDCCESTYDNGSSECSVSCGTGTKSVYEYSAYTGEYCGVRTETCTMGSCKEDLNDGEKCGMYISYRVGDTVYFTSNKQCDIDSVTGATKLSNTVVYANCNPKCTVRVKWTSGKYTWNGKDYTYTSWNTLKCTGIEYAFCTSSCPSHGCVR